MKTKLLAIVLASFFILPMLFHSPVIAQQEIKASRIIEPIISTEWLAKNLDNDNLVIIDIRDPGSYGAGHIPGAINEPFVTAFDPCTGPTSKWITSGADCLWLEMPPAKELVETIGSLGITPEAQVVIVTAPNPEEPPFYGLANGTRVADTLIYGGVKNVAVLGGGHSKWMSEGRPISKEAPALKPVEFKGEVMASMLVPAEYVKEHLNDAIIVDARDADVYFGAVIEPFAEKAGHIPGAKSLPAPWVWNWNDGGVYTYKDKETLGGMAAGAVGGPADAVNKEIIVYCGVGGYASSLWYVLNRVLGYKNVKLFDGSAQGWVKKYDMVTG